jgi:methionine-rich copper-binding protein CopC
MLSKVLPLALIAGVIFLAGCDKKTDSANVSEVENGSPTKLGSVESETQFENPVKSAHYVGNTPQHAETLNYVPGSVAVNFNFDLAAPSSIAISQNGADYGQGETIIGDDKLVLMRNMNPDAPDGTYTVNYKACWPDGSCHDGSFQFEVKKQ